MRLRAGIPAVICAALLSGSCAGIKVSPGGLLAERPAPGKAAPAAPGQTAPAQDAPQKAPAAAKPAQAAAQPTPAAPASTARAAPAQTPTASATAPVKAPAGQADDLSVDSVAAVARRRAIGDSPGAKVLRTALDMAEKKVIVKGACWDWVNKAFNDAGFPAAKRQTIFSGKEKGPYADPTMIKPGDWLYIVNFTFGNIGHSALFIDWIDFDKRSAITLEYVGQNKEMPGRFREYDITKTYMITRGRP